ncbi:cobalt ABC transporter permease [Thalassospira lucentensis]|uniref:cobalt ABC transporter permease n=1 Tax=Thalassospira lucentensis TaxID=168935 RepID=UPI00142DC33E|nr:cobalt ABC transporter permease [Thalassospira lucentensis]NIZ02357.1 cobalt ABC transporter permease [Thalassospira lucentensis]
MAKLGAFFALAVLLLGAVCGPAQAHKVIASVFASGTNIEGEIGFSNGDMAANTLVQVFDEDGTKLGEAKTDEDGFFVYPPTKMVNHVFRADLGAGHIAKVVFDISEMSSVLTNPQTTQPATPKTDNGAVAGDVNATPSMTETEQGAETSSAPSTGHVALTAQEEATIAAIVRDEVRPLRREIAAYKEKNDLQSILGAIGYIFGFFGIAFYIAARRLRAKDKHA